LSGSSTENKGCRGNPWLIDQSPSMISKLAASSVVALSLAGMSVLFNANDWSWVYLGLDIVLCFIAVIILGAVFESFIRRRERWTTMTVAELEEFWRNNRLNDWNEIKAEIDNGAEIVRYQTMGAEQISLVRNGKNVRSLYGALSR